MTPIQRLKRAAIAYATAIRYVPIAEQRARNLSGARGERAAELAANARSRALHATTELASAAIALGESLS